MNQNQNLNNPSIANVGKDPDMNYVKLISWKTGV